MFRLSMTFSWATAKCRLIGSYLKPNLNEPIRSSLSRSIVSSLHVVTCLRNVVISLWPWSFLCGLALFARPWLGQEHACQAAYWSCSDVSQLWKNGRGNTHTADWSWTWVKLKRLGLVPQSLKSDRLKNCEVYISKTDSSDMLTKSNHWPNLELLGLRNCPIYTSPHFLQGHFRSWSSQIWEPHLERFQIHKDY